MRVGDMTQNFVVFAERVRAHNLHFKGDASASKKYVYKRRAPTQNLIVFLREFL